MRIHNFPLTFQVLNKRAYIFCSLLPPQSKGSKNKIFGPKQNTDPFSIVHIGVCVYTKLLIIISFNIFLSSHNYNHLYLKGYFRKALQIITNILIVFFNYIKLIHRTLAQRFSSICYKHSNFVSWSKSGRIYKGSIFLSSFISSHFPPLLLKYCFCIQITTTARTIS